LRWPSSACLNSAGVLNGVPSGNAPVVSIGASPSEERHLPIALKFSSANPSGSIRAWHPAHTGFLRWASIPARMVAGTLASPASSSAGTLGGGGGGGEPRIFESKYFPRTTGEVLVEYDVTVRMLA